MTAHNIFTFSFAFLVLTSWFHLTYENSGLDGLHVQCTPQPYAQERRTWQCECVFSGVSERVKVYWPKHSDSSTLVVPSVTRQQSGTNYTCQVEYVEDNLSKIENTVVYLNVAHGPESGSVRIYGIDGPFGTDGTRNLTLTCNATDTNPKPSIVWLSGPCEGGTKETCIFQPQPKDDGFVMKCRAVNVHTQPKHKWSEAEGAVNLRYPPIDYPLLTGHKDYQIHKSGDTLTCTVTGGKPLVEQVIFNCSNPTLYDQADVASGTSVSSSLTIDSSEQTYTETTCRCSAVWKPDQTLYNKSVSVSFAIIAHANEDKWKIVVIIVILVLVLLITIVIWVFLGLWIFKTHLFPTAFTDALVKRLPKSNEVRFEAAQTGTGTSACVQNGNMHEYTERVPLLSQNRGSVNAECESEMLPINHEDSLAHRVETNGQLYVHATQQSDGTVEEPTEHPEHITIDDEPREATDRQVDDMDACCDCDENTLAPKIKLVPQPDDKSKYLVLQKGFPMLPDAEVVSIGSREKGATQDSAGLRPKGSLPDARQNSDDHETNKEKRTRGFARGNLPAGSEDSGL